MLFDGETLERLWVYFHKASIKFGLPGNAKIFHAFSCLFMPFHVCLTVLSDRIARIFKRSGIYLRLSTEFGMLAFFINLGLMDFQVRYWALFFLFSVIVLDSSGWEVFTRISS